MKCGEGVGGWWHEDYSLSQNKIEFMENERKLSAPTFCKIIPLLESTALFLVTFASWKLLSNVMQDVVKAYVL